MKKITVYFSILYVLLTVIMFLLSALSRSGPPWMPSFALGYLIAALVVLWTGFFALKRRGAKKTFVFLAIGLALASVSILATYNLDSVLHK